MKQLIFLVLGFFTLGVLASTVSVPDIGSGTRIITRDLLNLDRGAIRTDFVPRDSNGDATDLAGSVGNATFEWLKAFIASGYWDVGDVKQHLDFSGSAPVGQGWYPCDGTTINEANYNSFHSAGDWDTYIITSPLDGLTAPSMDNKYFVNETTVSESGDSVGNASHEINIAHTHAGGTHSHVTAVHNHQWYKNNTGADHQTFNTGGSLINIDTGSTAGAGNKIDESAGGSPVPPDSYTNNLSSGATTATSAVTGSALSTTQNIQPASIKANCYVRIIN